MGILSLLRSTHREEEMRLILLAMVCVNVYAISAKAVFKEAKKYTDYPSTIVAIAKAESSLGKEVLGDDRKSLGLMQFQVPTVRWLSTKYKCLKFIKRLSDKSIETMLLRNDTMSIKLASLMFEFWRKRKGYKIAIIRHNGLWEIDSKGKAKRDEHGNKILNVAYYNRVRSRM